ncbi:unnamed protein product, partial [Sphenostylis stenocarpa]
RIHAPAGPDNGTTVSTHDHHRPVNCRCRALRLGHGVLPPPSPCPAHLTRDFLHLEPLYYLDYLLPNPSHTQ